MTIEEKEKGYMVFQFNQRHTAGSVCCFPCRQCQDNPNRPDHSELTVNPGESIDVRSIAFHIIRAATEDEYEQFAFSKTGRMIGARPYHFHYVVTAD